MGTADLLKRASIRMPGRSPGPIKAALTQPLKPSAAAVLATRSVGAPTTFRVHRLKPRKMPSSSTLAAPRSTAGRWSSRCRRRRGAPIGKGQDDERQVHVRVGAAGERHHLKVNVWHSGQDHQVLDLRPHHARSANAAPQRGLVQDCPFRRRAEGGLTSPVRQCRELPLLVRGRIPELAGRPATRRT
jgi:hypothetical protein